jgi:hypothetical protein
MQNVLLNEQEDDALMGIVKMQLYPMIILVAYMMYQNYCLVWNTIDMIVSLCFLVYVNAPLPEHMRFLFRFFNLQWWGTNPEIITYFFGDIHNQAANENFERRAKTTLFLTNNDLLLFLLALSFLALVVYRKQWYRINNAMYLKMTVFSIL